MLSTLILTTALATVPTSVANLNTSTVRNGDHGTAISMVANVKPLFSADGYTPEDKMQP